MKTKKNNADKNKINLNEDVIFYYFLLSILIFSPQMIGMTIGFLTGLCTLLICDISGISAVLMLVGLSLSGTGCGLVYDYFKREKG